MIKEEPSFRKVARRDELIILFFFAVSCFIMDQLDLWNLSGFLLPSVNVCLYSVEQSVQVTRTDLFVKMETDNFRLEWYCHRRNIFLNCQRQNIYSFIVSCNSDPGSPLVVERLQEGPNCFYKDGSDCLNGN